MQGTELVKRRTRESAVADKQDGVRQAFRPALSDQRQDWVSLERLTYLPIPSCLTYYITSALRLDLTLRVTARPVADPHGVWDICSPIALLVQTLPAAFERRKPWSADHKKPNTTAQQMA